MDTFQFGWFQKEWQGMKAGLSFGEPVRTGLHTYPIMRADGSQKRLHLRVEADGNGILFVDVTDVIHLNAGAVSLVKMALDGVRERDAARILRAAYRLDDLAAKLEAGRVYQVMEHLVEHEDGCHTCSLAGLVDQAPIFSLPTNAPYKIDVALTYGCNNECPHCYNEVGRFGMPSLPLAHWYRVFERVAELGIPHVILTGGEATLHPDFFEIVRYADRLGMVVGLNSNGRTLSSEKFMQKAAEAGLNHVQVTLGSCYEELHNKIMGVESFHQTVKGIRTALESGVHVITNSTLMRSNMDHLEALVNFLDELGLRTFAMNGVIHSGGGFVNPNAISYEELPTLITLVRELAEERGMRFMWYTPTEYCRLNPIALGVGSKKCNAGEYSICIEPNGDILPCQSYYVAAGNLLDDPWEEIWQGSLFTSFRGREEDPLGYGLPEKCLGCPDMLVCGAGCRIEREAEQGVRVADMAGAGCIGCSGYYNPYAGAGGVEISYPPAMPGGFMPPESQVKSQIRSRGGLDLIQLKMPEEETDES
ncbi:MAG: radical SAM protein [Anaerolineales bacterium]|nr:radical SAM protein [Anaerolineales bacterium]